MESAGENPGYSSWGSWQGSPTDATGDEESELAYRPTEPAGATRSTATWVRPGRPGHAGRYGRTGRYYGDRRAGHRPRRSATQASAALVSGIRAIPSMKHPNEAGHLRPAVKVPVVLSCGDSATSPVL